MMHTEYEYDTNDLASLPKRWFGQFIDGIVAIILPAIAVGIMIFLGYAEGWIITVGLSLYIGYFLFADGFNEGRSIGKLVVGTRVVDAATGDACSFGQSCLRNVFYIFGIFDWIFIFGENRQRLGDKAAKTVVVNA
jgi:uncharacterized RDD family membrane protein YckC